MNKRGHKIQTMMDIYKQKQQEEQIIATTTTTQRLKICDDRNKGIMTLSPLSRIDANIAAEINNFIRQTSLRVRLRNGNVYFLFINPNQKPMFTNHNI